MPQPSAWVSLFYLSCLSFLTVVEGINYISTIAGTGGNAFDGSGGKATAARLSAPRSVIQDTAGVFYVVESGNNAIRKFSNVDNIIVNYAGVATSPASFSGDGGKATSACFIWPIGIALDTAGLVYISDYSNNRVRKVDSSGFISTYAGEFAF